MKEIISGIYCFRNVMDNKRYIGYAKNLFKRRNDHYSTLEENTHRNPYMQRVYNKYGKDIFEWTIIQELECDEQILKDMEVYWIAYFNSYVGDGGGYNCSRGGDGSWGHVFSEESKRKMSESQKLHADPNGNFSSINQQGRVSENSSSKYAGVRKRNEWDKFTWGIKYKGKTYSDHKNYMTEECAALAYNQMALELYGESAKLNMIPEEDLLQAQEIEENYRRELERKTSKYKYVSWNADMQKFTAMIKRNGNAYYGGRYENENDAAEAVNRILLEIYGENAELLHIE